MTFDKSFFAQLIERASDSVTRFPKVFLAALVTLLLVSSCQFVFAQAPVPNFRLCTGGEAGNYFKAGHILKSKITSVGIEVVPTQGSLDNLDKILKGECDGAFAQSDSLLVYSSRNAQALSSIERAGVLYQEHVHLLCNRSANINRVVDLTRNHTVAVGPDGSGARTTWEAFVLADKKLYQPVNVDTRAGVRALSAVADGSQVQCLLWVGALGSSFLKNDAQRHGDRLSLVGTDDRDMTRAAKDNRGRAVYSYGEIPSGTYPKIQPGGLAWGTKPVPTIQVDALFIASTKWINANERAYDSVLRGFAASKSAIGELVTPRN
jgi:TRAP-type uncharacterized transport system substrate-binding protein